MATCANYGCEETATNVLAVPSRITPCALVVPYCDEHADEARRRGAIFATGPALADELQPISGVRR